MLESVDGFVHCFQMSAISDYGNSSAVGRHTKGLGSALCFPIRLLMVTPLRTSINWAHWDVKCHNWTGESQQLRERVSQAMLWHFIALFHPLFQ